jgi:hypothetical protein
MQHTDGFSGPLFKLLNPTDAGTKNAKVSGPTLLKDIRDFFPAPAGPKAQVPVRAILVNETADGAVTLPSDSGATIQIQGSGKKSPETILSHINTLRGLCKEGDVMLFEPALSDRELYRITRVATDAQRYGAIRKAIGTNTVGLLPGGSLPRDRIGGMLRPVEADGELINGEFSVSGPGPSFEITFASGDGKGRNTDYRRAVATVLSRLAGAGGVLTGAWISSAYVQASGVDPAFVLPRYPFPLVLSEVADFARLSSALGTAGGKVNSPPGTSGSNTRRMTLDVTIAGAVLSLHALEERLAGCPIPFAGEADQAAEPLILLTDLGEIDAAWAIWVSALKGASRPKGASLRWMDGPAIMYASRPSAKRQDATDVHFGVHATGKPWAVEINAPMAAADANGLATVARNGAGERYLLRQGWLQANPDSGGQIRDPQFSNLTGLDPVEVTGASTPLARTWYVVAPLDAPAEVIAAGTADFVHRCAQARALTLPGAPEALPASPPLSANAEAGGFFVKKAAEAQPETLVLRIQGEVWLALAARLKNAGRSLTKIRHQAGYEVDGIIDGPDGPILLEIKTARSAADVYEGVGQLMLYAKMLELDGHQKVLLLAFEPSDPLIDAAVACGIAIFHYTWEGGPDTPAITFDPAFLKAVGADT